MTVPTRRGFLPREGATVMNDVLIGQKHRLSPVSDIHSVSEWYHFKFDLTLSCYGLAQVIEFLITLVISVRVAVIRA
jgi:hypothetical protein